MEESQYIFPDWASANKVHDWKNYASEELKDYWHSFTREQRKMIAECLQEIADREEWD